MLSRKTNWFQLSGWCNGDLEVVSQPKINMKPYKLSNKVKVFVCSHAKEVFEKFCSFNENIISKLERMHCDCNEKTKYLMLVSLCIYCEAYFKGNDFHWTNCVSGELGP